MVATEFIVLCTDNGIIKTHETAEDTAIGLWGEDRRRRVVYARVDPLPNEVGELQRRLEEVQESVRNIVNG